MTSGIKGSHTPVHGLVRSILSLQHKICVLKATTEHCRNLATKLPVGQLCSMTQLSPLMGWPRRRMDEAMMWYTLAANFASEVGPRTRKIEPFKHLLHPHLSCEWPWALAQDSTVMPGSIWQLGSVASLPHPINPSHSLQPVQLQR